MNQKAFQITRVLTLLTLTVLAVCLLLVLLTGASVYRNLVDRKEAAYARRTALQYLTTQVHQAETVQTGTLEGCDALILGHTIDGEVYTTHIYCYDGWLRELYTVPGARVSPSAGEALLKAQSLSLALEGDLLTLCLENQELYLYLPVRREAMP